jgi:hypothetical protein
MTRLRTALLLAAGLAGCGGGGPKSPAHLTVADETYIFDTVRGAPSSHGFRFTNDGGTATAQLDVSISGDDQAFTIVDNGCVGSLAPGKSCQVAVQLASERAEEYEGQLHVTDDKATVEESCILKGKVAPAELVVEADHDRDVYQDGAGEITITVTNEGGARAGAIAIAPATGFSVSDHCTSVRLLGGESCTVVVKYYASIDDQGDHGAHTGIAAAGIVENLAVDSVFHVKPAPTLHVSGVSYSTDPARYRELPAVTISNLGDHSVSNIQLSLAQLAETPVTYFRLQEDNCTGTTLAPFATCTVQVIPVGWSDTQTVFSVELHANAKGAHQGSGRVDFTYVSEHATLYVDQGGTGSGHVKLTTGDGFMYCVQNEAFCFSTFLFPQDTFELAAIPDAASTFVRWSGCDSTSGTFCTIKGQAGLADRTVVAEFASK